MRKGTVFLLASGGIDSTALASFYLRNKRPVVPIHFQYHQPAAKSELEAIQQVSKHYRMKPEIVKLGFNLSKRKDEFLCRNALFVLTAAGLNKKQNGNIAIGIHKGGIYYDTSARFLDDCQRLLDGYFGGTVRVEAPFVEFGKKDIFDFCQRHKVPVHLTYSCERSNKPCSECQSCINRERYFGKKDKAE